MLSYTWTNGESYAMYLDGFSKAHVSGNRCEAQTTIGMYIYSLVRKSTICSENIVTNFEKQGISVTSFEAMILDNICDYFTDTPTGLIAGIVAGATDCIIRGNKVTIDNSEAQTEVVYGIDITYPQATMGKSQIIQNKVVIDIDSENAVVRGTNVKNQSDCNVSLNEIVLINADANNDSHGMYFENADRSKIVGNGIYMQNLATDIGINLDGNTDNCQGSDNLTYLVGTSVADAGAGNAVTAQDV